MKYTTLSITGMQINGWSCAGCGAMNRKRGFARGACIFCDTPERADPIVITCVAPAATPVGSLMELPDGTLVMNGTTITHQQWLTEPR